MGDELMKKFSAGWLTDRSPTSSDEIEIIRRFIAWLNGEQEKPRLTAIKRDYSSLTRLTITLSEDIHTRIKVHAAKNATTVSETIESLLAAFLEDCKK